MSKHSELWVTTTLPQAVAIIEILRAAGFLSAGEEILKVDVRVDYEEKEPVWVTRKNRPKIEIEREEPK